MTTATGQPEPIPQAAPPAQRDAFSPPAPRSGPGVGAAVAPFSVLWTHRAVIARMARRDITARYRNSVLGWAWAVVTPLIMLGVYTFVFAVVLKARWGEDGGTSTFAARLFVGLILFQLFGSMMTQTPGLMRQNANLIKKVVFPVETLVAVRLMTALFDFAMGFLVFLAIGWLLTPDLSWGVVLVPIAALPVALLGLGVGWLLAGLGAYLTDLGPIAATLTTVVLFLSAVFYPVEIVPDRWLWMVMLNPIAGSIDTARGLAFGPLTFDAVRFGVLTAVGWVAACVGLAVFRRVRWGFADVL